MSEAPNWFFSACTFIGFILCTIPLPWHLEAWNTGTCLYMIWTGLQCLNLFINLVIWYSNVLNVVPIWCDIFDVVTKTCAEKLHDVLGDLAISLNHIEIGCYPAMYNMPPAYALVWCWPVVIGIVSAVYCLCTIRELALRRAQFKELLSTNHNMSSSHLMGLMAIEVLGTIPIGTYIIYLNVTISPIQLWISWVNTHYDFLHFVACAFIFIFFSFFGFADEARRNYWLAYTSFMKKTRSKQDMSYNSHLGMPVFITQRTDTNRTLSLLSLPTSLSATLGT
ncbi:pheromone A receptor-domain-containing protein [Pisolithus marmoratus]|nr:pheromone A receptor-domain-containing protein [Pisolithus marmoratus]